MNLEELARSGIEAFSQGRYDDAERLFAQLAESHHHRAHWLNYRARALGELGRTGDALECINACLTINPQNIADQRNRSLLLTRLGDLKKRSPASKGCWNWTRHMSKHGSGVPDSCASMSDAGRRWTARSAP